MNTEKEFHRIMREQVEMALATCYENVPNVRIVNFYYDDKDNVLYFSTFDENQKVIEFSNNKNVSFTTIPHNGIEHVRVKGTVAKSEKTIYDLKNEFINKIEGYNDTIEQAGSHLKLYEVNFEEAVITLDFENIEHISL